MKLTEKEAQRALRSLDLLRQEYDDYKRFRDQLEITHIEGLDDSCRGAKVIITRDQNRTYSLNMPYGFLMKWILEKMTKLDESIRELEDKFKSESKWEN